MTSNPALGILTGISYVSGIDYFAGINEAVIQGTQEGEIMSPNPSIVMVSVDCDRYVHLLTSKSYREVDEYLLQGVSKLIAAGCDTLVIASNTGHICVPAVHKQFPDLNVLHIADCCAVELLEDRHRKVALLGTQPTMEEDYLKARLSAHGIDTIVPQDSMTRARIYDIICQELSFNVLRDESRDFLISIICALHAEGAEACLLGCTEIELLVQQQHIPDLPLFPSARIHIKAAADLLLGRTAVEQFRPGVALPLRQSE